MGNPKRNGYHLQNQFEAWKVHNQGNYKSTHVALFTSLVSLNNKLKWVENFGVPRGVTMMQSGISNGASYTKAFNDFEEFGIIKVIQRSQNQHTATIISLVTDLDVSYKEIDGIIMDLNAEELYTKTIEQSISYIQKPSGTVLGTVSGTVLGTVPIYKQPNNQTTKQIDVVEVELDSNGNPIKWYDWFCKSWIANSIDHRKKKSYLRTLTRSAQDNLRAILKDFTEEDVRKSIAGLMAQKSFPNQQDFANDPTHLLKDEGVFIGKYLAAYESNNKEIYGKIKKFE